MPKIKNWSRLENPRLQDVEMQWVHDTHDNMDLFIESGGGTYPVVFQDRDRREREVVATSRKSLEDARKKAVEWMRNHPNPMFSISR